MDSSFRLACRPGRLAVSLWGSWRGGLQRPAPGHVSVLRLVFVVRVRVTGFGYAEDIWTRRHDIYAACAGSQDLYAALKEHACLHGLAATQVLDVAWCHILSLLDISTGASLS